MADRPVVTIEALQSENALLRQILESAIDSILAVNKRGAITVTNTAALRTFGYSPHELPGLQPAALFPPKVPGGAAQEIVAALANRKTWYGEAVARRKDGSTFPAILFLSCADEGSASPAWSILHVRDMTEQERMVDRLKYLSITDDLTGVYNVRYFWARLRYEFVRSVRYAQPLACLMADLDRFKEVNDRYGHRTGDEVLMLVAKAMSSAVREVDIVARYGGEEFGVILPNTSEAGALKCAENIRSAVAAADFRTGQAWSAAAPVGAIRVTVSLGAAVLTPEVQSEEHLAVRADEGLLWAKRQGRNRVRLWSAQGAETAIPCPPQSTPNA